MSGEPGSIVDNGCDWCDVPIDRAAVVVCPRCNADTCVDCARTFRESSAEPCCYATKEEALRARGYARRDCCGNWTPAYESQCRFCHVRKAN